LFACGFAVTIPFFFPIPLWAGWPTFEKIVGFVCWGFGNGALGHWITKNGNHDIELIRWWVD
jgi:hypothetical protein